MTSLLNPSVTKLAILFICFHLALATFYLSESENSDQVDTGSRFSDNFQFNLPSHGHENSFSTPLKCEGLEGCTEESSDEDQVINVQFKDDDYNVDNGEEERGDRKDKSRPKRYPEHLDPNQLPFYPFWIRVGECPLSSDGARQHYCPTPTGAGKWVCIDDYQLCDGIKNCPNAEDESSHYCLFYKALKTNVELLTRTISSLGQTVSNTVEESNQSPEMMRPKSSRLSWTVDK